MKIQVGNEVRNMTDEETAQYALDVKEFAAQEKAQADKVAAKAALLAKLGITADEAALLLG
jgi:hypothetical protein